MTRCPRCHSLCSTFSYDSYSLLASQQIGMLFNGLSLNLLCRATNLKTAGPLHRSHTPRREHTTHSQSTKLLTNLQQLLAVSR